MKILVQNKKGMNSQCYEVYDIGIIPFFIDRFHLILLIIYYIF